MNGSDEADPTAPEFDFAALITIDVQCDTLDGGPLYVPGTSECLPNLARLCEAFRRVGRPIVHVLRLYEADGSNAELCRKPAVQGAVPVLRPGTPGRRIAPAIVPPGAPHLDDESLLRAEPQRLGKNEIALYKPRWGAFYGTALDVHLRRLGVTTLVFVGCNFPNCPRTSIYEASERDYRIVLVEDAVSGLYERGERELRNIGVHLDLVHALERPPRAEEQAMSITSDVLSAILNVPLPPQLTWDRTTWIEKASGRVSLTPVERSALGDLTDAFPLLA